MNRSFAEKLLAELPELARGAELDAVSVDRLRGFCERKIAEPGETGAWVRILLGTLCALLIGAGIILTVAINWDFLPPPARLATGVGPLLLSLILGFWILARHDSSQCRREGVALAIAATTATAIAVVSQLYQVSGGLEDFLSVWIVLMLPMVYLFRSGALTLIVTVAMVWLSGELDFWWRERQFNWLICLYGIALLPALWRCCLARLWLLRVPARLGGVLWLLQIWGAQVLFRDGTLLDWGVVTVILLGLGWELRRYEHKTGYNLFLWTGSLMFAVVLGLAAQNDFWMEFFRNNRYWNILLFLPFYLGLLFRGVVKHEPPLFWLVALLPVVFLPGIALADGRDWQLSGNGWFYLYALVLAVLFFREGIKRERIALVNCGMLLILELAALRFFDGSRLMTDAFLLLSAGVVFGAVNWIWFRRRRKEAVR